MSDKVRTRFAPSPTGRMHVGNLRSALYEFLIAKHAGGDFMLRIEDTDQERYVEGAVDIIYRTMEKTGLLHDEGPDKDGGFGPYVQSERMKTGIYMKYAMVKTRIEVFPDIAEHIDFFETLPEYDVAMYTHKKMKTNAETSLTVLKDVLPLLEAQEDFSNDALYQTLLSYVEEKGVKNGYVMWPIRTAVSGKQMTPGGATELMEVLGKEESVARIKKGISMLEI